MDSPNSTKSDPSLLLLNEIEILLAQTRLMDLYLKQAQVTAANESARMLKQHQAELSLLRSALTEKEQIVAAQQTTVSETEKNLFEQVQNLQNQLSDKQRRLDDRDTKIRHADSDVAVLRNRIAQLQAANDRADAADQDSASVRQDLQSALTALRQELEENQQDFLRQQLLSRELQESLHTQLDQLQSRLIERQVWATAADTDLQQAKTEITQLHQRVAELQAGRQEVEAAAAQELERARSRFESELAGLQAALGERDRTLRETQTAMSEIERSVRAEIQTLHSQLGQKQEQIELRDGELRAAHAQIGALQEHIAELEAANQQVAVSVGELDRLRSSFAGEISNLQHEVAVRERALSERQEAVTAVELALHGKIQALQEELARSRSAVETRENEVANARAEADALRQRMGHLETGAAANLAARQLAEDARHALEADLTKLNDALAHKEAILAEHETRFQSLENQLRGEIADLRNQLEKQKRLIEQSNAEPERLRREIALLQEQKAQFEHSHRELEQNWQQAAASRHELEARLQAKDDELKAVQTISNEQKEAALREQEARFNSTEEQLGSELALLHSQLDQQQKATEQAHQELAQMRSELFSLREQNAQFEQSHRELEQNWQQAAALRQEFEARLQAKEEELRAIQSSANEQKEAALREQGERYQSLEAQLGSEIGHLRYQLEQQQRNFEQGNVELGQLRAETAALHEQRAQSEQSRRELEQNWQQAAALRQEFEARLQAKEEELRVVQSRANEEKESALREQEARFNSTEEQLGSELALLRNQLDQQQKTSEQANEKRAQLQVEISGLREHSAQSEASRREFEQNWQQAVALRQEFEARLHSKDEELRAAQAHADELKGQIEAKLAELQVQSTERQLLAESRAAEIGDLKTEISRLSEQSAARESALEEVRSSLLNETASSRAAHQAEIAALRDDHIVRQQTFEKVLDQQKEQIAKLLGQIHELEQQSTDSAMQIRNREQNLAASMAESGALRARLQDLENLRQGEKSAAESEVEQVRSKREAELGSLRNELQQKTWALAQHQASMENLALAHRNQIQKLEDKLAEQQNSVKDRSGELETAHSQTRSQQRRIEELELGLQHAQLTAVRGAEQIRQEHTARTDELNSQVSRQAAALQERETAQSHLEQMLRGEIDRLIRQAQEKNLILQSRNDELVRAKSDRDSVQERYKDFESAMSQNEAAATANAERMRTEFQAQLALLQAELSQKEWDLEEQRAAASGMDQQYREQIEALRRQPAQTESRAQEEKDQFILGEDKLTGEQLERYKKYREIMDSVTAGDDRSFPASESRRWRTRFGWKRRWKS